MSWNLVAALMPLVFLGYQLVIDWVNLFPWNDVAAKSAKTRVLELLLNYSPLLLISYGFFKPTGASELYALLGSAAYLLGHLNAWWRPYLLGASPGERQEYAALFSRTYKFLPPIKDHPIPDAEHVVVGLICGAMLASSILAYRY